MGLDDEAAKTRDYIAKNLSFDHDIYVKNFEITIRLLGGLLSNYQLTGDKRLLALAEDLGNRLLPAFNSPTGMPYVFVNLKTGATRDAVSNPAEIGTLLLEFGTLSKLTGNPIYYDKAKRALVAVYDRRSPIGLVGTTINVETGEWVDKTSHISGMHRLLLRIPAEGCHPVSTTKIASACGRRAKRRSINIWPTKFAASFGTARWI